MDDKEKNIFLELSKVKGKPSPIIAEGGAVLNEEGELLVDVYESPDEIIVQAAIAGVTDNDLDINITNESVTIKGERKRSETIDLKDYFYQECYWGKFGRSIILPEEVDPETSTAVLDKGGVLTIKMPKLSKRKSKKVKIKTAK